MIRVLIVDDSPTMRAIIRQSLSHDQDILVVGEAGDAHEARAAIKALSPDILTLDINMPHMSGLEFLDKLMSLRPMPAVILSSAGQLAGQEALARGGVSFIAKPQNGEAAFVDLPEKLKQAVRRGIDADLAAEKSVRPKYKPGRQLIAVGASTGGVEALLTLFANFPVNCPPTVVTQHMPAGFTSSFSERLNRACAPTVSEAWDGAELKPGRIYIAPGGASHLEIAGKSKLICRLVEGPLISGHRPSVDALFLSASKFGDQATGIILTGMGQDGAAGLLEMKKAGARTFGQDKKTSLVFGMPRAAQEMGAVTDVLPLDDIADAVLKTCSA